MIGYLNWGIDSLLAGISSITAQLPSSPISVDGGGLAQLGTVMGYASYFLPIHEAVVFLTGLAGAIGVFYFVRIALRWFKVAAD